MNSLELTIPVIALANGITLGLPPMKCPFWQASWCNWEIPWQPLLQEILCVKRNRDNIMTLDVVKRESIKEW